MSSLDRILGGDKRLVVCVGPGGVGKTSLAAAMAIEAARRGLRVFVLTIDPAKRLADALGIALSDTESRIALPDLRGTLDAAMLDTGAAWDSLVAQVATDSLLRARILENPVYRAFSRTFARSHAYVAMERLHDALRRQDRWDLIVLDTPPMRSALDVLDAPASLARFADQPMVALLAGAVGIAPRGSSVAIRNVLRVLIGDQLSNDLGEFLTTFAPLRRGFRDRARHVQAALIDPRTSFVLIAAPERAHLSDAGALLESLGQRSVSIELALFNRAFEPLREASSDRTGDIATFARDPARVDELNAILETLGRLSRRRGDADRRRERLFRAFCAEHRIHDALLLPRLLREPCTPWMLSELLGARRTLSPVNVGDGAAR